MKISSNFHDYYDSLRSTDQDDDPLYVRLHREVPLARQMVNGNWVENNPMDANEAAPIRARMISFNYNSYYRYRGTHGVRTSNNAVNFPDWVKSRVIGFCGRLFPVISIGNSKNGWKHAYSPERTRKLIQEYVPTYNPVLDPNFPTVLKQQKADMVRALDRPYDPLNHRFQFTEWANFITNNHNVVNDNAFRYFRAPVLLIEQQDIPVVIVNPNLREYDFVQVYTPPQAYQELSMYIGNNLANLDRKEPRPITDKLRAETKGFDKWSFKNQKNRKVSERGDW